MSKTVENVLLVVIDALRVDRVDTSNGGITPNINELASDGEVFTQCYSCINTTDPSLTTIETGQYPLRHGIINHGDRVTEEEKQRVSGAKSLSDRINDTHETIAIDVLDRWHRRGFEKYISGTDTDEDEENRRKKILSHVGELLEVAPDELEERIKSTYRHLFGNYETNSSRANAGEVTNSAINNIESADGPWFLLTHYWDTHIPYISTEDNSNNRNFLFTRRDNYPDAVKNRSYKNEDVPIDEILNRIAGSQWEQRLQRGLLGDAETIGDVKRQYDAAVWRTDQELGRLIDFLKSKDKYENTAIIVTADHGESLTEHDIFFDHHGLYDSSIHVPLIIKAPGFYGQEDTFVQHFDLAPTVLDLLEKQYNDEEFDGTSLVSNDNLEREFDREAVVIEEAHTARRRAIRTDSYKYITRLDDSSECRYCSITHSHCDELYDLHEDPLEKNNIHEEYPEKADALADDLDEWLDSISDPSKGKIGFEESEAVMDRLEDMGYL